MSRPAIERRRRWQLRDERGSISIEAAIVFAIVIVTFFGLMIVAGRIINQENKVRSAAHAAARAASLRSTFADASADVDDVANANLADADLGCTDRQVAIVSGPGDFVPGGFVTVEVRCTARVLGVLGMSDNEYAYEATEVIDVYRGDP
ncbi:MAG: TadE/TadG family type IV pilus assembly protein [Actinomycetota bacterium]